MKPYPKPEKKPKGKRKPIKPRSDKRAKQEREYSKMLPDFFKENPFCQVDGCKMESQQCHHKKGRLGALLTNKKYFMAVCAEHHEKIERNPNWAIANGYSLSRLKNIKE